MSDLLFEEDEAAGEEDMVDASPLRQRVAALRVLTPVLIDGLTRTRHNAELVEHVASYQAAIQQCVEQVSAAWESQEPCTGAERTLLAAAVTPLLVKLGPQSVERVVSALSVIPALPAYQEEGRPTHFSLRGHAIQAQSVMGLPYITIFQRGRETQSLYLGGWSLERVFTHVARVWAAGCTSALNHLHVDQGDPELMAAQHSVQETLPPLYARIAQREVAETTARLKGLRQGCKERSAEGRAPYALYQKEVRDAPIPPVLAAAQGYFQQIVALLYGAAHTS